MWSVRPAAKSLLSISQRPPAATPANSVLVTQFPSLVICHHHRPPLASRPTNQPNNCPAKNQSQGQGTGTRAVFSHPGTGNRDQGGVLPPRDREQGPGRCFPSQGQGIGTEEVFSVPGTGNRDRGGVLPPRDREQGPRRCSGTKAVFRDRGGVQGPRRCSPSQGQGTGTRRFSPFQGQGTGTEAVFSLPGTGNRDRGSVPSQGQGTGTEAVFPPRRRCSGSEWSGD